MSIVWRLLDKGSEPTPGAPRAPESDTVITDTCERGFKRLICTALTGAPCDFQCCGGPHTRGPPQRRTAPAGPAVARTDYERQYCVDQAQFSAFLRGAQPDAAETLALSQDTPARR